MCPFFNAVNQEKKIDKNIAIIAWWFCSLREDNL
jgi:hypothetical protein